MCPLKLTELLRLCPLPQTLRISANPETLRGRGRVYTVHVPTLAYPCLYASQCSHYDRLVCKWFDPCIVQKFRVRILNGVRIEIQYV